MNPETPLKGLRSVLAPANRTLDHTSTRAKTSGITKLETRIGQLLALTHALKPIVEGWVCGTTKVVPLYKARALVGGKGLDVYPFIPFLTCRRQVGSSG